VRFDDRIDVDLLLQTVDVERGCCPFFELTPDLARRELAPLENAARGRDHVRVAAQGRHREPADVWPSSSSK
jgi:hypothetical protein